MNASPVHSESRIVIVGAGPTGLGAAWRLHQDQPSAPFVLVEEASAAGGTAGSWTTPEGFTFDYGGHVLFPHAEYDRFLALLEEVIPDWHDSVPVRGIWIGGKSIPTPVQRNIHRLPFTQMLHCLWGLYQARMRSPRAIEADALSHHLKRQFGSALSTSIMEPLNRKMWATEPENMGTSWTGHRSGTKERNVADVQIRQVIRNWVTRRDLPSWTPDTRVRYPARGGSGRIWSEVASLLPSELKRFGVRVIGVNPQLRELYLNDGSTLPYKQLVSSIPLDTLLRLMVDQPELRKKAEGFRAARVQIFGFGVRGAMPDQLRHHHAVSIPSPHVPFWRLNIPSNFSPGNAPQGTWSILCECSLSPESSHRYTFDDIESSLRSEGFIPPESVIVSRSQRSFLHGYPVPFAGRDELLTEVQCKLEKMDIYSRGRFGGWRYEVSNQDHAFMQGVEVIDRLLLGTPEYTYKTN